MIGQTISRYRIVEKLGGGGMGVVYKAEDTELGRFVALKFLPHELSQDPQALERFRREARAASALNHPNICTIYEIGKQGEQSFIAMEFLDGLTMKRLIAGRPIDTETVLSLAIEIADGLDAAHSQGIIHRDIKPANIFVTTRGHAKVLDFGLAKVAAIAGSSTPVAAGNTMTAAADEQHLTSPGSTLGTVAYMSPEQARAKELDARSDLFSFGAVLYEMSTGQLPFRGESAATIFEAILSRAPVAPVRLNPEVPPELERIINKALEKDRDLRYQHAADLRADLKRLKRETESRHGLPTDPESAAAAAESRSRVAEGPSPSGSSAALASSPSSSGAVGSAPVASPQKSAYGKVAAALAVAVLLAGGAVWWRSNRVAPEPDKDVTVVPLTAHPGDERDPTFSPDGSQVAFAWGPEGGNPDIYVKLVGPGEPIRLTNTPEDERMPQWSPDGQWIAFPRSLGAAGIIAVPALGGPERAITREQSGTTVSWTSDSQWLTYATGIPRSLYLAPLNGGEKKFVLGPLQGKFEVWAGVLSPDSREIALTYACPGLYVVGLSADYKPEGEPRLLTSPDWRIASPAWTADGEEIWFIRAAGNANLGSDTTMYRVSVNGGEPQRVSFAGDNPWFLGIARRGNRMAFTRLHRDTNIYRVELPANGRAGQPQAIISSSRRDDGASYSPDGSRIAFVSNRTGPLEIWIASADGKDPFQLTSAPDWAEVGDPQWSPDGSKIAYSARPSADSATNIVVISSSGGPSQGLTNDATPDTKPSWSLDGRWIYFASERGGGLSNIWKVASSGGPATEVTQNGGLVAQESPDRKWLYFAAPGGVLRRMPVEGGQETQYLSELGGASTVARTLAPFFVTAKGVYYLTSDTDRPGALIRFMEHPGGESKTLGSIARTPSSGFSVSRDGHYLLYSQYDQSAAEILLVDNFR